MKKITYPIRKSSEIFNSPLLSRNSFYTSVLIILFVTLLGSMNSSAQQCSFKLTTTSNIESVNNEGRIYFIEILNKSNEEMEINLSVSNDNTGTNPDKTESKNNVKLNSKIINEEGQEITGTLKLKANESIKFQVKLSVPEGTQIEHWNKILLIATSEKCTDYTSSLSLFTFIPNPAEK